MNLPIECPGSGSYSSKIMFVGEAPAKHEVNKGIPFCGSSGDILWGICDELNLKRDDIYVTNIFKIRMPGDNVKRYKETGYTPDDYLPLLFQEINAIKPNVILGMGNFVLSCLTKVIPLQGTGIMKWRGSILPTDPGSHKFIPTIHPAALIHGEKGKKELYSWKQIQYLRFDINKCIEQSTFPEIKYRQRQLHIAKTAYELNNYFRKFEGCSFPLSVDIETFKAIPITIAFAFTPDEGISVPLVNLTGPRGSIEINNQERSEIFRIVTRVLSDSTINKIGHNYKFDQRILERWGFVTNGFYADTLLAASVIYPELDKKLAVQSSIYTNEAYYKDEGREYNPAKDQPSRLLNYNTKDVVSTSEVFNGQLEDMKDIGVENFYFNFVMPLHNLYRDIESVGLNVDFNQKRKLDKKYNILIKEGNEQLNSLVGKKVNFNSPKQMTILLFGELGCPIRKDTNDETLQALKNNVLMKNESKWDKAIKAINLITNNRKLYKTLHTYIRAEVDLDGRMRTSYSLTKETGRTSTNILKPPLRHRKFGLSFQTITKHSEVGSDIRSMFIPDDDCVFLEADQSQAEARVVLLLAKEYDILEQFDKIDIHLLTRSWIPPKISVDQLKLLKEMDKEQYIKERQLGKRVRHAGGYDMREHRLSELADIKLKLAKLALETFHKYTPGIRDIFYHDIKECLLNNDNCLTTPFGRFRKFYEKWGDKLFKEAYAHIPQSTISDNTKRAMLGIKQEYRDLRIAIESHDGFTGIVHKSKVQEIAGGIKYYMELPIDFTKCSLSRPEIIIPCEFKIYEKNLEVGMDYKI